MTLATGCFMAYYNVSLRENYRISEGAPLQIDTLVPVTASYAEPSDPLTYKAGDHYEVEMKMFGIIPVKSSRVEVVDPDYVAVLGTPFGIRMYTDGVLVVELCDIQTVDGKVSPARNAGIKIGDYVLSVDGVAVHSNEELATCIEDSQGASITVQLRRGKQEITVNLVPVMSAEDGLFRAGLLIRDSSAGIGILTFYAPNLEVVCGLGHAIYDSDTGGILSFRSGELVGAKIISVHKGVVGSAGELKGRLTYTPIGPLLENCKQGVYASMQCRADMENLTKIAHTQDVKSGKAQILTTLEGTTPALYDCEITVKEVKVNDTKQDMVVTVTDPVLLEKTGGIVQGMSGSPILQNGCLVGAVTHVLVDNPAVGYGLFAEVMLDTARESRTVLQNAS